MDSGFAAAWQASIALLAERMTKLGTAVTEHILLASGHSEFLMRLSDPFWFQALGCVTGMDWHSSGVTTSVMGALNKEKPNPVAAAVQMWRVVHLTLEEGG